MTTASDRYRSALLKYGIATEIQSPEHMKAMCVAVMKSRDSDESARRVIEHGRFVSKEHGVERYLLIVPPDKDVIRSVVSAMMPIQHRGSRAGMAALMVLRTLRPSGAEPCIAVPAKRLRLNPVKGIRGDIAAAYSANLLSDPSDSPGVKTVVVDDVTCVVLSGSQETRRGKPTDVWAWDAGMIVDPGEWKPDPDEWHYYYGRRVTYSKKKPGVIGKRVKFVARRLK
jgi:hypothetical protein